MVTPEEKSADQQKLIQFFLWGTLLVSRPNFHDISSNSLRDTSLWSKKCQGRVGSRIKDCYKVILIYELETLNIYINKLRRCGNISLDLTCLVAIDKLVTQINGT